MSYCFNPSCSSPQNLGDSKFCQNCGSKLLLSSVADQTESIVYRGIQLIGQGGFGRTFLVVEENKPLTPYCVIKQFFPQVSNAKKATELFEQEAKQLKILGQHPQIPTELGYFEQDGYQYLVQEFIDGKNLAQELQEKGVFTENKILFLLKDLLPILQFVHEQKVIHRDIKPENIIRRFNTKKQIGNLVLVDFGAAKLVTGGMLPKTGTMIGSAAYTAPEQLMGKAVFASDLYSLGVTCIHLLTNVPPFDLFDSAEGTWVWRDYLKTPVSDQLGYILDKMLQGATRHRYNSAAAILQQINPKPDYVPAMPGLKKIDPETGFQSLTEQPELIQSSPSIPTVSEVSEPTVSEVSEPRVSSEKVVEVIPPKPPHKINKISEIMEQRLEKYGIVQVTVTQTQSNQLTIVLNRDPNRKVTYKQLVPIIGYQLTHCQISHIDKVKLLGRVNNKEVPEWTSGLKLDRKTKIKNKMIRFQHQALLPQLLQLASFEFWIKQIQKPEFWMDGFMGAMIIFVFTQRIIILTPIISVLIAGGFLGVKHLINRTNIIDTNQLFIMVSFLFLMVGGSEFKVWVHGMFGIILGGLVILMPVFFPRNPS